MHILHKFLSIEATSNYHLPTAGLTPQVDPSVIAIKEFVDLLDKGEKLQALVKAAKTPEEIIHIAESEGIKIGMKQLQFWSKELKASYFPWAQMGRQWREEFFARSNHE